MRQYIINLTDNLIGKHRLDRKQKFLNGEEVLRKFYEATIENDVAQMSPETLGKIMCSLEIGDVMISQEEFRLKCLFWGDGRDMLNILVTFFLARVIYDRLKPWSQESGAVPYRRGVQTATPRA